MANHLNLEKKKLIINCLVEGNSIRATGRLTGVHQDTVGRLALRVGEHCQALLDQLVRGVKADSVECDEIWAYVQKKQKRCSIIEKAWGEVGDQYTFVAMDSDTKLVISHVVGRRDALTTRDFIRDLCARLDGRTQISTDGFEQYVTAIEESFGEDIDFAQVVKEYVAEHPGRGRYSPPSVSKTTINVIKGNPVAAGTSYVERQNLTMRMQSRRFTRLTNAFSKRLRNLKAAVALHFAWYNLCRVHRSLKVTPAMEAGLTDHVWDLGDLLACESPAARLAA